MSKFLAMGGYAVYVWSSVGVFVLVLLWNAAAPLAARAGVLRQLSEERNEAGDRD